MYNFVVQMIDIMRTILLLISLVPVAGIYAREGKSVQKAPVHFSVVADSATRMPLPCASIFDREGNSIGICNSRGKTPYLSPGSFPITVRYMGFKERIIDRDGAVDTIFLQENPAELPEVVVESRSHKVMHMLAYVREYSTLSTYSDTVFLFREKMVDYMLTPDKNVRFRGWVNPRLLRCKSYYRFTNSQGLDSVNDHCNHHFSWSDWMGIPPSPEIPPLLRGKELATDTVMGKYGPAEVWVRNNSRVTVNVNVLAEKRSRKWVPNLSGFFQNNLDFENFRVQFNYDNVAGDSISPIDLAGYSFNIESNGRGHAMFRFNKVNEPFYVSTYAEVYIIDKEFITVKEARKWERHKFDNETIEIYEPAEAPELQPSVKELIARVNTLDTDEVRIALTPDHNLVGRGVVRQNFGQRALSMLKTLTGISRYKMNRNNNRRWKEFRKERVKENTRKAQQLKEDEVN